ncbi:hypothetical protein MMC18_006662 [Xylographa bjoerkii]|nr:hypothetical protein [Xylographa bjoerkii]
MWGANVPTHAVTVLTPNDDEDGEDWTSKGEIMITENLAQALQLHRHEIEPHCLWADQLCIDQQNIPERSAQVRIMKLIFEKAHAVHCWLGLEPFGAKDGMAAWKKLNVVCQKFSDATGSVSEMSMRKGYECIDIYDAAILGPCGDIVDRQLWEAIFVFLRNPWWHRTWIVPEVSGKKDPRIVFQGLTLGLRIMSFALLSVWIRLSEHMGGRRSLTIYSNLLVDFSNALAQPGKLLKLANIRGKTLQDQLKLIAILRETRLSVATDPRDKVFAAVACMSVVKESSLLAPDYSSSIRIVYGRVVEYMIRRSNNLKIFAAVQHVEAKLSADLPSWIPDWRMTWEMPVHASYASPDSLYNASGSTQAQARFDINYVELRVAGVSVDTIRAVSTFCNNEARFWGQSGIDNFLPFIRDWYALAVQVFGILYRTGVSTLDAFCITMVMDYKLNPKKRGNTMPTSFTGDRPDDMDDILQDASRYYPLFATASQRFLVSQDGYMGLCPWNTQIGDKIFILLGGEMPAVLRPVEGGYWFIGFAYVHGLMDGEAMVGLENGQYQLQEEITLL